MLAIRPAAERGSADHGWLDTRHTFSFGQYHDPRFMGYGSLRVVNEDRVAPGQGFPTHAHQDMEIVTYVIDGALEHRDSLGTGSVIRPGDVQRMSAGTGVRHSEFNASHTEPVHFLQIWILPERAGLEPGYEQRHFDDDGKRGRLRLVASRDGRDGSLTVHQDVDLHATMLAAGAQVSHRLGCDRKAWLQVVGGALTVNGEPLQAGDGAAVEGEPAIDIAATDDAEALLFDMGVSSMQSTP